MKKLSVKIEINREWINTESGLSEGVSWTVEHVNDVSITGGSDSLQDTCTIKLAKNTKWKNYDKIPIRRGDEVRVWMGYDGVLQLRFFGYVKEVSARTPTTLTCEDSMFVLQKTSAKKSTYASATLESILKDQLPDTIQWQTSGTVKIGQYRVTATTVAGLLQNLKKNYGIESCFILNDNGAPVLLSYTVYPGLRTLAGKFEENKNIISDSLTYRRREDIMIKVKGISIQGDNSRVTYEEGEGEVHTIHRYGLTLAQLKAVVKDELERLKWEGLSGYFETFGLPAVQKCDVVEIQMSSIERGRYQVKGVNVSFGQGGYRQAIELGRLITEG